MTSTDITHAAHPLPPMIIRATGHRTQATKGDARDILDAARALSRAGRTVESAALVNYAGRILAALK